MNHKRIYDNIVNKAKLEYFNNLRFKGDGKYYEWHHITPRCLGGDNSEDNMVMLTGKEHFICHALLCYIYPNESKLLYAFNMMKSMPNTRRYITSSKYSNLKILFSKAVSNRMTNIKVSDESRKKRSEAGKRRKHSDHSRNKIAESNKGNKSGIGNKSMSGKIHSEESRRLMSESHKGNTANTGKKYFNNGIINKMAYECPEGFVVGMLRK